MAKTRAARGSIKAAAIAIMKKHRRKPMRDVVPLIELETNRPNGGILYKKLVEAGEAPGILVDRRSKEERSKRKVINRVDSKGNVVSFAAESLPVDAVKQLLGAPKRSGSKKKAKAKAVEEAMA